MLRLKKLEKRATDTEWIKQGSFSCQEFIMSCKEKHSAKDGDKALEIAKGHITEGHI